MDHSNNAAGAPEHFDFRFVNLRGVKYLRLEDVAKYLRLLGTTEEADVRDRLNAAAANLAFGATRAPKNNAAGAMRALTDAIIAQARAPVGSKEE